jgi:phosphatidate cytidylyltransferase
MKELVVRSISGLLYISIVIFSLYTSREGFLLLFLILGLVTIGEFLKLIRHSSLAAFLLFPVFLYFFSYDIFDDRAVLLLLFLTLIVNLFLLKDLLQINRIPMFERKKYISIILYLISGFVFLTLIPWREQTYFPEIIVGLFIMIWSNDSFAYLIGKNFGKRKLLSRISPKKTVEGFIGGLIGSLIASVAVYSYFGHFPLWMWIAMAAIASVLGTAGDLIQSRYKRQAGVKDSGALMPGHGGLYDRLDSIIYVSPFVYAFLEIADYVS